MSHNGNKAPRTKGKGEGSESWFRKKKRHNRIKDKTAKLSRRKNRNK